MMTIMHQQIWNEFPTVTTPHQEQMHICSIGMCNNFNSNYNRKCFIREGKTQCIDDKWKVFFEYSKSGLYASSCKLQNLLIGFSQILFYFQNLSYCPCSREWQLFRKGLHMETFTVHTKHDSKTKYFLTSQFQNLLHSESAVIHIWA